MKKAGSVARQVWQEFSPRDGEELACREDGIFEVTIHQSVAAVWAGIQACPGMVTGSSP
jgi:hypothetical protein